MSGLQKNVASQKWRVFAFNITTGTAVTGDSANITGKIDKDWAGQTAITDTNPTETEDGYYLFDLTQAETNADALDIYPESSTGSVQVIGTPGTIYTVPAAFSDNPMRGTDSALLAAITIQKNSAYSNFPFEMVLTTDGRTPATGLTVTGERSIDGGAYAAVSGAITEVGSGTYKINLLAADTNGDKIIYKFSSATADDTKIAVVTS